jgi:hypothetical protein
MTTVAPALPTPPPGPPVIPPPPVTYVVNLVSGKPLSVQTREEQEWFNETRTAYLAETKFTERTDLLDLDRLLVLELMVYRWTQHLASGQTYEGDFVDEKKTIADIKLYSDQINKLKTTMNLTKAARDDMANDGNFALWLADLKARAKMFGVHRERQLTKALTLMMELSTVVGTFDRADVEERRKTGFEDEKEIVDWIRRTMLPEFHEIDEHFRTNSQRYWVRSL